jgi:hypothetical protein
LPHPAFPKDPELEALEPAATPEPEVLDTVTYEDTPDELDWLDPEVVPEILFDGIPSAMFFC